MDSAASRPTIEIESVHGRLECFENDLITRQIREFGAHTRPEFAFALATLDPRMSVFDMGAHVGTFALAALTRLLPGTRLLCVEGNPETYAVLERNLADRGAAQVETRLSFVGNVESMAYQNTEGNTGAGALVPSDEGQALVSASLDELAARYFIPDFIKIDVEGSEFDVLSASTMLRDHRPILYLEIGNDALARHGHTATDLNDLLSDLDYAFYVNTLDRNAAHDLFRVERLERLDTRRAKLFDAVCIPRSAAINDPMARLAESAQRRPPRLLKRLSRRLRRQLARAPRDA